MLLLFLLLLTSCSHQPVPHSGDLASYQGPPYPQIFSKSLDTLVDSDKKPTTKNLNETDVIDYLQRHPDSMNSTRERLLKDIAAENKNPNSMKPLRLRPPEGQSGYSDLKFYASHPYFEGVRTVPPSNLVEVWRQFILSAKKQIVVNVFDFDLKVIAEALVEKAKAGLQVQVGIDKKMIGFRKEVKDIAAILIRGGVTVTAVDAVGLNNQKLVAIDWDLMSEAAVLFSSGNLTQSCLEPEREANHVVTMKSWLAAQLVHHEMNKTLTAKYQLRGSQYPVTGSFQITGPGVRPDTFESYPENSFTITFTPGGGLKNVNKNLLARLIESTSGPVRMIQYSFSSEEVSDALLARASREFQRSNQFDFLSVGDMPFAMQDWSQFLRMSGWVLKKENGAFVYDEDMSNPWLAQISTNHVQDLRKLIRLSNSGIHHKILSTGGFAVLGTSFNFSRSAETNNEQILIFKDQSLAEKVDGMTRWLASRSTSSVDEEVRRRNQRLNSPELKSVEITRSESDAEAVGL